MEGSQRGAQIHSRRRSSKTGRSWNLVSKKKPNRQRTREKRAGVRRRGGSGRGGRMGGASQQVLQNAGSLVFSLVVFFFVVGYCLEPSRFTDRTEKFPIREKSCSRAARTHEESHGEKKVRGYHAAPDERGPSSSAPAPSASIFFQPRPASTPFIFVFRFFYDSFSDRMECKYVECGERGERGRKKVTTFKKKI